MASKKRSRARTRGQVPEKYEEANAVIEWSHRFGYAEPNPPGKPVLGMKALAVDVGHTMALLDVSADNGIGGFKPSYHVCLSLDRVRDAIAFMEKVVKDPRDLILTVHDSDWPIVIRADSDLRPGKFAVLLAPRITETNPTMLLKQPPLTEQQKLVLDAAKWYSINPDRARMNALLLAAEALKLEASKREEKEKSPQAPPSDGERYEALSKPA